MKIPEKALKFWDLVGQVHGFLVVFFLVATAMLVFIQVLLRYIFNAPLMGIEEFLLPPMAWLYMLGAAYASYSRAHIDCGIILLYVKRPMTYKLLKLFRSALVLAVCIWLLGWAWWYNKYTIRMDKEGPLGYIRMVYVDTSVFYGIALMTIYSFVEFADWLLVAIGKKELKPAELAALAGGGANAD